MNEFDSHGLTKADYGDLKKVFCLYPEVEKAILFGSRALGTHNAGSDIDIALIYKSNNPSIASGVKGALDDRTSIPYFIDVLDVKDITSEELQEHIRRHGVTIYTNTPDHRQIGLKKEDDRDWRA